MAHVTDPGKVDDHRAYARYLRRLRDDEWQRRELGEATRHERLVRNA
jgi:hypothetical protein